MDFTCGILLGFFGAVLAYCLGWYHGNAHERNLNPPPPVPQDAPTNQRPRNRTMWG